MRAAASRLRPGQSANPDAMTLQDALRTPAEHAARVQSAPHYANYPNQYRDDVNWLQLTLVFPQIDAQSSAAIGAVTPAPVPEKKYDGTGYDGAFIRRCSLSTEPDPFSDG